MSKYNIYDSPSSRREPNCRSCTDFKTWSRKQSEITKTPKNKAEETKDLTHRTVTPATDCPLDKDSLGQSSWGLLHTIAAVYPNNPTDNQKKDVKAFFDSLSRLYPCEYCSQDFQKDLKQHPVNVSSQANLSQWLCNFHNRVNEKLGKPQFDCSKVDERWRDGWKDGSCD